MRATRIAVVFIGLLVFASLIHAAEVKLGFSVRLEGEGFFINPLVKKTFCGGGDEGFAGGSCRNALGEGQ